MPRTAATGGSELRQCPADTQAKQHRPATTWSLPLPPQGSPEPSSHPPGQSDQYIGRFAEPEIAAPAPHIRRKNRQRLLQAHAPGPTRDGSNARIGSDLPLSTRSPMGRPRKSFTCLANMELTQIRVPKYLFAVSSRAATLTVSP